MNAHIINCSDDDFQDFICNGYIGVGLVCGGITHQQLSIACRTSYSMYADMKTVRQGDIIFIHAKNQIYGIFEAVTEFREDATVPSAFLSPNMYYSSPTKPGMGLKYVNSIPKLGKFRKIAIKHYQRNNRNLCFKLGFDSNEVFELRHKNKIWSIPERWLYTDQPRTVRPLMLNEALELYKLLKRENSDKENRLTVKPADLTSCNELKLILNPNIVENEKIIEGWVLSQIGVNPILDDALGPLTCYGNNIPVGYLKFADILGYQDIAKGTRKYKTIEIKKDECQFPENINQLLSYLTWISENLTQDSKLVEGIILAKDFNRDCVAFVNNFNSIMKGPRIRLIKFSYSPMNFTTLNLKQVA